MGGTFDPSLIIYISCCLDYGTVATNNHKLRVVTRGSAIRLCCESFPPLVGVEVWSALLFTFSLEKVISEDHSETLMCVSSR